MKKLIAVFAALLLLIVPLLQGCSILAEMFKDERPPKEDIIKFVTDNKELLLSCVENGNYDAFADSEMVKNVYQYSDCVNFFCGGFGVAPSGGSRGFYYSPNDDMTCVSSISDVELVPSGDGWAMEQGDNCYYTELICDHFYYYDEVG